MDQNSMKDKRVGVIAVRPGDIDMLNGVHQTEEVHKPNLDEVAV